MTVMFHHIYYHISSIKSYIVTICVQVDQVGPVHDRTYTYSLTIGPQNSEDVIVTCGIAKGKKEAKRRCCEAMVLKVSPRMRASNQPSRSLKFPNHGEGPY